MALLLVENFVLRRTVIVAPPLAPNRFDLAEVTHGHDPNEMATSFYAVYRELGRLESADFCMGDQ